MSAEQSLSPPLLEVFRHHSRELIIGICVAVLWAVAVYVLIDVFCQSMCSVVHFHFTRTSGLRCIPDR